MKKILNNFVDLIYPRRCPLCHRILKIQRSPACPECMRSLRPIGEPRCEKCGRPVKQEQEYCTDCEKGRTFREGRGIFLYDERMKRSILLYKYGGRREYGTFFARALCIYGRKELLRWRPDLIIPVPMHKRKQRQRGFNQAEDLAVFVGRTYGIPVVSELVRKARPTEAQKQLDAAGRRNNLKNAFLLLRPVTGLRILIVDDVFTTGSTVDTLSACLKNGGASEVFFLTVAIALKKDFS